LPLPRAAAGHTAAAVGAEILCQGPTPHYDAEKVETRIGTLKFFDDIQPPM